MGHIRAYKNPNGRMQKWLKYNPFANKECQQCIALPVCMGGCAAHAMDLLQYENRCGTFRHTYKEQVLRFVESAEEQGGDGLIPAMQLARPWKPASAGGLTKPQNLTFPRRGARGGNRYRLHEAHH